MEVLRVPEQRFPEIPMKTMVRQLCLSSQWRFTVEHIPTSLPVEDPMLDPVDAQKK